MARLAAIDLDIAERIGEEAQTPPDDLFDRVERPEFDDEIDNHRIGDLIMDIRRDLGLENRPGEEPWTRRTAADWADCCASTACRPVQRTAPSPAPGTAPPPARGRGSG